MNHVDENVRKLIGFRGPAVEAVHPVDASEVRRFHHAIMDDARRYYDGEWAVGSRYGGPVAPPAFPVHMFRRAPNARDPLQAMERDPDFDGFERNVRPELPLLDIPLKRLLNGGYEYELFRYARVGERVFRTSGYRDIHQKDGRSGAMVFVVIDDEYRGEDGGLILRCINTLILR